ncbi:hypothetical protein ACIQH5_06240 [Paenarthrobacter sp. NPDC091711]|uniref:hypothetical protein n=1 Tax=Paenarthrobacter sp. NPDC091711 TaxID=3364385 RepID=UPI0038193973
MGREELTADPRRAGAGPHPLETPPASRQPWVWRALPIQIAIAFIVMPPLWVYIHLSLTITYDGILTLLGLSVTTVLAPSFTIFAAVVIGLPLRLVPKLQRWWTRNGEAGLLGVAIGYGFLVAGSLIKHRETGIADGIPYNAVLPDATMLYAGWLVLGFFITHSWLPLRWYRRSGNQAGGGGVPGRAAPGGTTTQAQFTNS